MTGKDNEPVGRNSYGWRARVAEYIWERVNWKQAGGGRQTSRTTRSNITTGLLRLFGVLRKELGFKIENPAQLDERHLQALFNWMEGKWEEGSLKSSTIQGYVSYLRILCRWNGKEHLMEQVRFRNPDCSKRKQAAEFDKSWEAAGIDIPKVLDQAWEIEPWVAMALLAQAAFGLRRKEALCLVPAEAYRAATGVLAVTKGTKGGRGRVIRNLTPWQYEVVALLIEFCRRGGGRKSHIGGVEADLKTNIRRYAYVLGRKLGITRDLVGTTGHGLRAGFACRMLEAYGVTAPVRGGDASKADPQIRDEAYTETSNAMGHSRHSVVGAYAGALRARGAAEHPQTQDPERINPPDMDELIATIRRRSAEHHRLTRQMKRMSKRAGLEYSSRMV